MTEGSIHSNTRQAIKCYEEKYMLSQDNRNERFPQFFIEKLKLSQSTCDEKYLLMGI